MNCDLTGYTAVVTGGAVGIGLGIVEDLLSSGSKVLIADASQENLNKAAEYLKGLGLDKFYTFCGDLSEEHVVSNLFYESISKLTNIHILVNCAGGGVIKPFLEHTPETFNATIDRNLWTTLWCSKYFLETMVENKYGRIINIGADSVRNGLVDHAAYNAAKGGVHGLTTGLAREFAPYNITVNTVAPSAIRTQVLVDFEKKDPELAKKFISVIPLGRAGEIKEVASLVTYLSLPIAGFITGQVISVNGGSTML